MKNTFYISLFIVFLMPLFLVSCGHTGEKEKERPNILFAISDDQSWVHTGMTGCRAIKTPVFDKLAGEGIFLPMLIVWHRSAALTGPPS